jgi:hypothetical protein
MVANSQTGGAPTGALTPPQPLPSPQYPSPQQPGPPALFPGQPGYQPQQSNPQAIPGMPPGQPGAVPQGQNPALDMIRNLLTTPRQGPVPGAAQAAQPSMATGIAGVASKYEGQGIKRINERSRIDEWEFVFDYRKDNRMQGQGTTAGTGPKFEAPGMGVGTGAGGVPPLAPGSLGPSGGFRPGFGRAQPGGGLTPGVIQYGPDGRPLPAGGARRGNN